MGYTKSLAQLRQSFLVLGQYEGSADIDPPGDKSIANEFINNALEESYNICVTRWDDYYTTVGPTFTTVSGTDSYTLPTDFYKFRKLERLASGSAVDPSARWERIYPIAVDDTHRRRVTSRGYQYRLARGSVVLVPPPGNETFRVWYIPLAPQLALDSDTVQFDTPVEMKLVITIALRDAYQRQDLPTQEVEGQIAKLSAQLRTAGDHDAGEPLYLGTRTGDRDDEDCY